ncbi:hypothetical protein ABPG74_005717 [Tetrahymena malaccensis]
MDSEADTIILKPRNDTSNDEGIIFSSKLAEFSKLVEGLDHSEVATVDISREILLIIKRFLEDHNYDKSLIRIEKPLTGNDPKNHLDEKTYLLLKEYKGTQNVDRIKPLLDAAYYLNFELFKDACLCIIACDFYVGATETELDQFIEKNGLKELSPEEELEIMKEFAPVFEKLNEKFKKQLDEEQLKYNNDNA